MALKFVTDETIEVDVNGQVYQVKIPSLKELTAFEKKITSANSLDAVSLYEEFFASYGLPLEATDKFGLKHWKMLVEEFSGTKKG
mgnify:CR=1 FL=1